MEEQIFAIAQQLTHPQESETTLLQSLCRAAYDRLSRRLRSGISPAHCQEAFSCAVALTAAASLLVCRSAAAPCGSLSVDGISLQTNTPQQEQQKAALLEQQARVLL